MFYFCSIISVEILGVNKFGVIIPLIIKAIFTGISFLNLFKSGEDMGYEL